MNIETIGLGGGNYPTPIEKDETNIEIHLTIKTTDIFPETWNKEEIEDYVKSNISEYLQSGDIEIHEVEV